MDPTWQAVVQPTVREALRTHGAPGALFAHQRDDAAVEYLAVGADGHGRLMTPNTLFAVASITKLATALVVVRLVDAGTLRVDEPLATCVPEAAAATLGRLLTHTSGLAGDYPEELAPRTPDLTWEMIRRRPSRSHPSSRLAR